MKKNTNDKNIEGQHIPILLKESLEILQLEKGQIVVDCTLNRAGHSVEFLKKIGNEGLLIGIDLDSEALKEAEANLIKAGGIKNKSFILVNDNFANLKNILDNLKIEKVDAVYADLGISSQEIDISGRGFSFLKDEPLIMNFKFILNEDDMTAEHIVNNWAEETISDILFNFSDEKYSRKIAKSIVESRDKKNIHTTFELNEIIKSAIPKYYERGHQEGRSHFATKTYQALRMAVNGEIDNIIKLLDVSRDVLRQGGKIAFITFHSTEDRIVKHKAKDFDLIRVNKKVIVASKEEVDQNPRSRSAKLRVYTL